MFAITAKCDTTLQYSHWIRFHFLYYYLFFLIIFNYRPGGSWHPEYLTLEHLPIFVHPSNTNIIVRKIDPQISSSLIQALKYIHNSSVLSKPFEKFITNSSKTPSTSVFGQLDDKEIWLEWLYPLTINYYSTLIMEFLMSLTPPTNSNSNSNSNVPNTIFPLPKLNETGKTYNYKLTCCHWLDQQQIQQQRQLLNNTKYSCRECFNEKNKMIELHQDMNLLHSLSSISQWEDICIGFVCGKISPIYIRVSFLLQRFHEIKPVVMDLLTSLNEIRE